jgi:hypothetical protein
MDENFTRQEIAHYVTLFFYNWEKQDFLEAYKDSHLGDSYVWNKLQDKIQNEEMDSTAAMVDTFLNLDDENQLLLINYILDKKYTVTIDKKREWNKFLEKTCAENNNE